MKKFFDCKNIQDLILRAIISWIVYYYIMGTIFMLLGLSDSLPGDPVTILWISGYIIILYLLVRSYLYNRKFNKGK